MRIALGVEYHGTAFYGWQAQADLPTIQGHLETALAHLATHPVQVIGAGRTDAGVHAVGQVAHCDVAIKRPLDVWVTGTNTFLPPTIAVRWARYVDADFHARFSATSRVYRYIIDNRPVRPAVFQRQVSWYHRPLEVAPMQEAAATLIGEHDFSSFRSAECEARTPHRCVTAISVRRAGYRVIVDIEANAFLHHMVRNIVGSLLKVGEGICSPDWIKKVLLAKDRREGGVTAPPEGLYFMQVRYPGPYIFPSPSPYFFD